MSLPARRLDQAKPFLEYGEVVASAPELKARTSLGLLSVEKAFGCLVDPAVGDRVLLSLDEAGAAYVLQVLDRPSDAPVTIAPDRTTVLGPSAGDLALASPAGLSLAGARVSLKTTSLDAVLESASFIGRNLRASFRKLAAIVQSAEGTFKRLSVRSQDRFSHIADLDETQAGTIRLLAEETASVHATNTLLVSREETSVTAERILMG